MPVVDQPANSSEPPNPRQGECLFCYLERSVGAYGCRGHQGVVKWRDAQPAPMPGLTTWLERHGGYCDCEVLMNVWNARERPPDYQRMFCPDSEQRLRSGDW